MTKYPTKKTTTDGRPLDEVRAENRNRGNKLYDSYVILKDEYRSKDKFFRIYRDSYVHVGRNFHEFYDISPAMAAEIILNAGTGPHKDYVKLERLPLGSRGYSHRYRCFTQDEYDKLLVSEGRGCNTITSLHHKMAETIAVDPIFYDMIPCASCGRQFVPECFTWSGTGERVGT